MTAALKDMLRTACDIGGSASLAFSWVLLARIRRTRRACIELLKQVVAQNEHTKALLSGSDDFVVVPREPTAEMVQSSAWYGTSPEDAIAIWASMLSGCDTGVTEVRTP
jgi:hypothetical protein